MSSLRQKLQTQDMLVSSTGVLAEYQVEDNSTIRIAISQAGAGNSIYLYGKITGQSSWTFLQSYLGNQNSTISVSTYDYIRLECIAFDTVASDGYVRLNVSGFEGIVIDDDVVSLTETWSSSKINSVITSLGDRYVRSTRFTAIGSGTSGTITISPNQTIILDDFGGTVDAVVSTISGGKPTFEPAKEGDGTVIATTFDSGGNYTFSGTPSSYPVALIYRVKQKLSTFDGNDLDIVGEFHLIDETVIPAPLSIELRWDGNKPSFYLEPTYNMSGRLQGMTIWDSPSKNYVIFTNSFTYTGDNVTTIITTRYDGKSLQKDYIYDINNKVVSVTRTYTP